MLVTLYALFMAFFMLAATALAIRNETTISAKRHNNRFADL